MSIAMIGPEAEEKLDWIALTKAIEAGHVRPRAEIGDTFLYRGNDTMLSRAAWIDGLGSLVKTATIFPGNPARGKPMVNGGVALYDDETGQLSAIVDFHLVTKWKTAGDSLLAARKLARPDSETILIVGAGTVGRSLREAYGALFPKASFIVWNRSPEPAAQLADHYGHTTPMTDLAAAVAEADIITCATMADRPLIAGDWLKPGQHLDLIGAYRPDMREADDRALTRSRIFLDSRDTVLGHIGELKIPLEAGVIAESDVVADYYDFPGGAFARRSAEDITLFKNGGGAHLDLMVARYILDVVQTT
ncbi:Ornithine cyclodeaminase [Roseibacterium elongatum DSM 19469]|uniref:Ornithine cyclodeaminase n=1 Tax=Roseicyclus elongatus DSM 19469 TaxID=1294273 RepID=W8S418_9RHOB|nr:NAD(P)-binding domain-containing protein [Roseibacterium elongatum]AHM03531.1 Ornithine cyclodeaminase [Roseibacterium elongatum DSM 19469]